MKRANKKKTSPIPELQIDAPLEFEKRDTNIGSVDEVTRRAKRRWTVGLLFFIIFVFGVLAVGFEYITLISRQNEAFPSPSVSRSPSPLPTPTLSPLRIVVKNGSGVSGLATKVSNELKSEGYGVIDVSNAPSQQTGTTIFLAPQVSARESELRSVLLRYNHSVDRVEVNEADDSEVVIVLGK